MSDTALARRVLAGDEAAFEEFFDRYFPRLYRFAHARLGVTTMPPKRSSSAS
jgi:RNA polymerase sigma-70 factor (ECF subfamily)